MEKLGIYAIYDKKAERYDTPYFAISDLFAKRRYALMADEPKSVLTKWKDDFQLMRLGTVSTITGEIDNVCCEIILEGREIVDTNQTTLNGGN